MYLVQIMNQVICIYANQSIVTFGIREKFIGFSNTSRVDSLYRFRRPVFGNFKSDICILQKGCNPEENNMKIQYANDFVNKLGMGDTTTCVYQFIYD